MGQKIWMARITKRFVVAILFRYEKLVPSDRKDRKCLLLKAILSPKILFLGGNILGFVGPLDQGRWPDFQHRNLVNLDSDDSAAQKLSNNLSSFLSATISHRAITALGHNAESSRLFNSFNVTF